MSLPDLAATIAELSRGARKDVTGAPFVPAPMASAQVQALRLPDGAAMPKELLDWWQFDTSWFPRDEAGAIVVRRVREIFAAWATDTFDPTAPDAAEWSTEAAVDAWIELLPEPQLADAWAIELTYVPGSQEHLVILDGARTRVLGCERRFELWWKYDSFTELVKDWLVA